MKRSGAEPRSLNGKGGDERQGASARRLEHLDVAQWHDGCRFHEILEITVSCAQRDRVAGADALPRPEEGVAMACQTFPGDRRGDDEFSDCTPLTGAGRTQHAQARIRATLSTLAHKENG